VEYTEVSSTFWCWVVVVVPICDKVSNTSSSLFIVVKKMMQLLPLEIFLLKERGEFDQFFEPFWSLGIDGWMTFSIFLANLRLCLMKSHLTLLLAHICPNCSAFKRGLKYLHLKTPQNP